MRTVNLFVYGTLMRGEANHGVLERVLKRGEAQFLGEARVEGFELYDLGSFPVAVPGPGQVEGERYRIPRSLLIGELDRREGFPHSFDRKKVTIEGDPHWMYFRNSPPTGATKRSSGSWKTPTEST